MALMAGILESFDEVTVAPGAADVLRGAAPGSFDQSRIGDVRFRVRQTFDLDRMLPAVAEVVEIAQRLDSGVFEDIDEPRFAGVERSVGPFGIGEAKADVFGADFVKVAVRPAQRGL